MQLEWRCLPSTRTWRRSVAGSLHPMDFRDMSHALFVDRTRLESIDVVRGVIMIIMALDHTRDFFGMPGQNPTNLAQATAALFLTRWITYFCAPVFFLLTGTGAYLSLRRRSPAELSRLLLTRGLWLI